MSTYGPHDPATAPDSVLVLASHRWPDRAGELVPLPRPVQRQREQLNGRAAGTDRASWREQWAGSLATELSAAATRVWADVWTRP